MANRETNVTNAAETTLSSSLAAGATTINVTSTSSFPTVPFYIVIDPDVDASREIVLVDSAKTATTFTLTAASSRGQDGTTDTSHSSGARVACVPVAALWTDINDRVDAKANTVDVVSKAGGDTITASGAAVIPLVVKGAASQTANLLEAQDSAGTVLALVGGAGDLKGVTVAAGASVFEFNAAANVRPPNATSRGLVVRCVASQAANAVEVQDNAGTVVASILPNGRMSLGGVNAQTSTLGVQSVDPALRGLTVRGAASQTANLAEFQNSAGTMLVAVTAGGLVNFGSAFASTATAGGGASIPATVAGFLGVVIDGVERRIPYYAV